MGLGLEHGHGQTPLDEDEKEGLIIRTIATHEELDEFEQGNIEDAMQWVLGISLPAEALLTEGFICSLHKRMFGNVWLWAGKFRLTDKNIGIEKWQIRKAVKGLCDDTLYWIQNQTFAPDEIALRFKHRLVSIHCFPNGNGRHSRLMADIIIDKVFKIQVFSWGSRDLAPEAESRLVYLKSLKAADQGDFKPLMMFARS